MMGRWLQPGARSGAHIPGPLWTQVCSGLPFVRHYDASSQSRLQGLCAELLGTKVMTGAGGMQLTADIQLAIAVQACIPILELGFHWYRGWHGIVVYPSEFHVHRQVHDENGLVHEYAETLSGESWDGGPVILSWPQPGAAEPDPAPLHAGNVVIHEFAHKLDQLGGDAEGRPPFDRRLHAGLGAQRWDAVRDDAFERLNAAIDLIEDQLPAHVDPESDEAAGFYSGLPLDPYAAQDPAEFFAVSSEAFFVAPAPLRDAFPQWFAMLARFYRQEPLAARP